MFRGSMLNISFPIEYISFPPHHIYEIGIIPFEDKKNEPKFM